MMAYQQPLRDLGGKRAFGDDAGEVAAVIVVVGDVLVPGRSCCCCCCSGELFGGSGPAARSLAFFGTIVISFGIRRMIEDG